MKQLFVAIAAMLFLASCEKKENLFPPEEMPTDTFEKIIEIKTDYGNMYMWLYKETPLHRKNFLGLADTNFFDGTTFHRCIKNFMIQGGDPNSKDTIATNDGQGGPGYTVPAEILSSLKHSRGEVAAARLGDAQNPLKASSGSQFYICVSTTGTQHLNNAYTVFGKIIKGIEVVDSIVKQPQNPSNNRPLNDIKMNVNVMQLTRAKIRTDYGFEAN